MMNSITVRNIPDSLHKKLQKRSRLSRRSLNSEIIACLEEALMPNKNEIEQLLEKSNTIRSKLSFTILNEDIDTAKSSGRL
jgi:plasmid stability protein